MGRTPTDKTENPEFDNSVTRMPTPIRGSNLGSRSKFVNELVEVISDGEVHRISNADKGNKATWARRLRYAARIAEMDVEVVFIPEGNSEEPGIYFRGHEKGSRRNLRDQTDGEAISQ